MCPIVTQNAVTFAHLAGADKKARIRLFNGQLADVERGEYFNAGTELIIQDGKIAAMPGLPGEPQTYDADLEVDLHGCTVIPGLFNAHCHVQMKYPTTMFSPGDLTLVRKHSARQIEADLADCLARGITHLRDGLEHSLRPNRAINARSRPLAPRIHPCVLVAPLGGTFTRSNNLFTRLTQFMVGNPSQNFGQPESGIVAFPAQAPARQVRDAVDRAVDERGARYIKIYDQHEFMPSYRPGAVVMSDEQLEAACDQARKRGVITTMHHTTVESFRRGIRAGVASLVHLPSDASLSDEDVQAFVRAGCTIDPTLTIAYCLAWPLPGIPWDEPWLHQLADFRSRTYEETVQEAWLPELQPPALQMFTKAMQNRTKILGLVDLSGIFRYWSALGAHGADNLKRIHRAGGRITCGNDAGAVPMADSMIGLELALLRLLLNAPEEGLVFDAGHNLRAATLHSAQALGLETQFGTLQSGKVADLVVLDGDPFEHPELVGSRAAAVFMEGTWVNHPLCYNE